jgi:tetratricopeptide (TPR) repeat protein
MHNTTNDTEQDSGGDDLKQQLVALLAEARAEQLAFLGRLGERERADVESAERWSAKDLLAHIGAWWGRQGGRFVRVARGEQPDTFDWTDAENAETYATNRDRSWEAVADDVAVAHATLLAAVRALSVEDLTDPARVHAMRGRPLWRLVVGNGYRHPQTHLAEHYLQRGEIDRATALRETMVETLSRRLPELRAIERYNLACFYATMGRPGDAVAQLGAALTLAPELLEVAREDHDLDALRALPAFQALDPGMR